MNKPHPYTAPVQVELTGLCILTICFFILFDLVEMELASLTRLRVYLAMMVFFKVLMVPLGFLLDFRYLRKRGIILSAEQFTSLSALSSHELAQTLSGLVVSSTDRPLLPRETDELVKAFRGVKYCFHPMARVGFQTLNCSGIVFLLGWNDLIGLWSLGCVPLLLVGTWAAIQAYMDGNDT